MTEKNFTGLVYDNIFPKSIGNESKKINFHDSNDLILNSQKEEIKKFSIETKNYLTLHLKRARLDLIAAPITESFGVIIGVVLLWYGGSEVILQRGLIAEDFIRFILILFSIQQPKVKSE